MQTAQYRYSEKDGWINGAELPQPPQIVFVFGETVLLKKEEPFTWLKERFPNSLILGCSTAGEIQGTELYDDSIVATAVHFEATQLNVAKVSVTKSDESERAGKDLASLLPAEGLRHVMVFSEGLNVNGTTLVRGLRSVFGDRVVVTGGLAGDQANFKETVVCINGEVASGLVVAVGFYGDKIQISHGSMGGWDAFGPIRTVTKSQGNVLYELDGKAALGLYKEYLGDLAAGLPATGLLFPLNMQILGANSSTTVVRTILSVDEASGSLTFAGDIPEGSLVQLMKANFDRLIEGAGEAAAGILDADSSLKPAELAILISCVGRKLVLKQRVEEELESVSAKLGKQAVLTGFYSYGEISPVVSTEKQCELHNQTMTITAFAE